MTEQPPKPPRDRGLTVYLFNIGQGDHMLLRLPNGEYGIIDFFHEPGTSAPPALGYLQKVRRRLKRLNPRRPVVISFLCISHPDYDHLRGLETFLNWIDDKRNNIQLDNLWIWPSSIMHQLKKLYEDHGNSVEKSHKTSMSSDAGRQLDALFDFCKRRSRSKKRKVKIQDIRGVEKLGQDLGGVKVVALAPLGEHVRKFDRQAQVAFVRRFVSPGSRKGRNPDQNLLSSILLLIYGKHHRLLFGGDAGKVVWRESFQHYNHTGQDVDHGKFCGSFIKASHHGSKYSSLEDLWPVILSPGGHVGISAGRNYDHPHRETLEHILPRSQPRIEHPKVWSTNTCNECQLRDDLPPPWPTIDWVLTQHSGVDLNTNKGLDFYRSNSDSRSHQQFVVPKIALSDLKLKNFAAYIFRFKPNADGIKVTKAISEHARSPEPCPFLKEDSDPFPYCPTPEPVEPNADVPA